MSAAKLAWFVVLFSAGAGVGVLWSPIERPRKLEDHVVSDVQSEDAKFVEQMIEIGGEETSRFAKQFESMTIRIKEYPLDAIASRDGRFSICLFGSDETIASDLVYPDVGGAAERVRHYSFSCDGRTYSCDFGRSVEDAKMKYVLLNFTDAEGRVLSYMDSDLDGRWDAFVDRSQEPSIVYERDGHCWKERAKDADPHH